MARLATLAAVVTVLFCASCQGSEREPARLQRSCPDGAANCVDPPPTGAGGTGGVDGGGGDASVVDAGAAGATSIAGALVWLDGDDFDASQPFLASGTVRAQGAAGGLVATVYDGTAFALDAVLVSPSTWFIAAPERGLDALTTITAFDTRTAGNVMLPVARPSTLDLIFSVLTTPTTLDPDSAQLVLRFVDVDRFLPVEGVVVSMGQAAVTAYAVGGTWSDDTAGTSVLGLAIVGNLPAVPVPGSFHEVALSGAVAGTLEVLLAAGSLTLVDVGVGG